jgi:hypothetical protein
MFISYFEEIFEMQMLVLLLWLAFMMLVMNPFQFVLTLS